MVDVVAERRVVLLLVAEAVERLDIRAAVRAVDPGHRGTPLELRDLRSAGQSVAHAEQRLDVDAVVDWDLGCGHVVPPCCGPSLVIRRCIACFLRSETAYA